MSNDGLPNVPDAGLTPVAVGHNVSPTTSTTLLPDAVAPELATPEPARFGASDRRELALRRIFDEHHGSLPAAQRDLVVRVANAERWTGDVSEKLNGLLGGLGSAQEGISYAPTSQPQAPLVSNSGGAPAMDPRTSLPVDIFAVDPTVWNALPPKEKKEHFESYKRARGVTGNPFAFLKSEGTGQ